MADSVHSLLVEQMEEMGLSDEYVVTQNSIVGFNGTEFLFKGVRHNVASIKSIPNIDILWLEEADSISAASWEVLIPTVRDEGSEIWVSFNPRHKNDPTYQKFVGTDRPPENSYIKKVNWRDNPWFPDVLNEERLYQVKINPELSMHVWEGECIKHSKSAIFSGRWEVRDFDPDKFDQYYQGLDFGFAMDPTAAVRMSIVRDELMICREAGKKELDIDKTSDYVNSRIQGWEKLESFGDSSRPETISYLQRHGMPRIKAVKKWPGSLEDGIDFLKSFRKIVVHPDCIGTINELTYYSYKVDKITGDILPDVVDAYNHYIDAIRYGLGNLIANKGVGKFSSLIPAMKKEKKTQKPRW
jgi:phage terminase large subunit